LEALSDAGIAFAKNLEWSAGQMRERVSKRLWHQVAKVSLRLPGRREELGKKLAFGTKSKNT